MPFKKNPVSSEKICSLARFISALPHVAWENAALSHLERTLDDSANKRLITAEAFIALDEILLNAQKIVSGLIINTERIAFNLSQYAPFAATEAIIIEAVKKGANRQEMHELLRSISMVAWQQVQTGKFNPMGELLLAEKKLIKYLKPQEIKKYMDVSSHVGDAPERAMKLAKDINKYLYLTDKTFTGISAFHLIEHMTFKYFFDFLVLARERLTKNGILIMETPNIENVLVSSTTFNYDHTHSLKLPKLIIETLLKFLGFTKIKFIYLHPSKDKYNTEYDRLFFGPQDLGIIAYK